MNFLRNRASFVIVVIIGLAIVAFVVGDVIHYRNTLFGYSNKELARIAGHPVSYDEFAELLEQNTNNLRQQYGNLNAYLVSYAHSVTWDQLIGKIVFGDQIEKLGYSISASEIRSLIQGAHPSPQVVQAFTDPQTGEFDRAALNRFLNQVNQADRTDPLRKKWQDFVEQIIYSKKLDKYLSLIKNGLYINSLEAHDDYEAKNKMASFSYTLLSYTSIPDSKIVLSEEAYRKHYKENINRFNNPQETRSFDYVTFDAIPSKEDTVAVQQEMYKLADELRKTNEDSLFVAINAETKFPLKFVRKGQLGPELDTVLFHESKGFMYGPYLSNGFYKVAKLVASRVAPDSVTARHILLRPNDEGGLDKAMAKLDSLKSLIQTGKQSFAALAASYSADKGSAAKGGSLGTFGHGTMVPAFEEAAFNGKVGDLVVATTQFGVHLIKIDNQKGALKEIKVALIDKALVPGKETQSAAYKKAQNFLSAIGSTKDFDRKLIAEDVAAGSFFIPNLDNAREVIKWAFEEKKGAISHIFELTSANKYTYVIARLSTIKKQGLLPLEMVKKQIEPEVRDRIKGQQLAEQLKGSLKNTTRIEELAKLHKVSVATAENVSFANPEIPGIGREHKVVGAVFGAKTGKISEPILGKHGVYVFIVRNFSTPAPLKDLLTEKRTMTQNLLNGCEQEVYRVLKDNAQIKDYRTRFF